MAVTPPGQGFHKKVAVVGLGRMGSNIAKRLAGQKISIGALYDKNENVVRELAHHMHTLHAKTLAEVNANAEIVITCVSDDEAVEGLFAESGDSLLLGASRLTFIECSTVSPRTHREVAKRLEARRAKLIEACMSDSIHQAHDGTLYLILGGDRATIDELQPLLTMLAKTQVYVGDVGRAAAVKALINMVMNANTAALAEGLALGAALGINLDELREIFANTGAQSRVLMTDGLDMAKREHHTFFSAAHARKDTQIALDLAKDAGLELPVTEATKHQYDRMVELGLGNIDKSGISELTFRDRRKRYETAAAAQKV
ncbi:MAG: NAD(P)-dependent oxidoreductase [Candidatus Eremiobacteraeota bacterium]|nr:NAD(P)-dependent oxidoreductase [Candidatus Eremiobacteraeota bacterium]